MTTLRAYLQTKVARRVFSLFLVCAVVPTVTLIAAGYWLVARELRSQAAWQLAQAGKISGALLLSRIQAADRDLAEVHRTIRRQRTRLTPQARLRRVQLVRNGLPPSTLSGSPTLKLPEVNPDVSVHLASGRAALVVGHEGKAGVFLVRSLSPSAQLWGEISPDYLWGDGEDEPVAPTGVDICVYAASTPEPLYCSSGRQLLNDSGEGLVTGTSSIFLGYEFSAPPWTVLLQQPLISASAMAEFGRTVILTGVLGLSLVVLASSVLLRRSLDPVVRLQEGTRRLAAGNFSMPVQVTTGDEFEELAGSFNSMATELHLSIERLNGMSWSTLEALGRTIDANSPWTAGHSDRVTRLAMAIGRRLGLGSDDIDRLHRGGLLHDIGKIGIPRAILDKPGPLTLTEMALVREHPVVGARILEPIDAFADVIGIVRHHHERFNGQGYPDRLAGDQIPKLARIAAVADVYDALVSERPYRARWEVDRAIRFIAHSGNIHFDPAVVAAFLELAGSADWDEATRELMITRRQLLPESA
jgi:putative nucleotidyltransferase with HDIG domain